MQRFNPELTDNIIAHPDKFIAIGEEVIRSLNTHALIIPKETYKPKLRIFNLPDVYNVAVQNLGAGQLDKLVKVEGAVSWITDIYPRMQTALWECVHCWQITSTKPDKTEPVKPPAQCKCGRNHFNLLEEKSEFVNLQRARVQEMVEKLRGNTPTSHVDLWLESDLVNLIAPGEKLVITGVLRLKPNKEGKGKSSVYSKYLDIVHVHKMQQEFESLEISKEEEKKIRDLASSPDLFQKITASIAPSIYGYSELKQAVALQLFGGTPNKKLPDGHTIRNDVHILLIGDPGCLVGDERVVLGNGAIVKIGEVGKTHLQNIKLKVQTGEGSGKTDTATVFHSYKKQPVIEIITESGKSIKGTYNHPLMAVETKNGRLMRKWKQLDEFKRGDKVATVTGIRCGITAFIPTNFAPLEYHRGPRFKGKLPEKVTIELAEVLGYCLGDGWVRKKELGFVVAEPEKDILQPLVQKCRALFGVTPHVTTRTLEGRTVPLHYASLSSSDVAQNLLFLREKRVPNIILQSGNKVAAAFLKWLFEADGTVFNNGRGRRAVGLKAKNVELLRDVQMLLLRFGIHSRIIENALLIRRGKEIIKFANKIGFVSQKKRRKVKQLAKEATQFSRVNSQRFEKIVEIRRHLPQDVFDIEVPHSNRFIANGIVSHNTGKSAILQYVVRLAPKGIFTSGKSTSSVGLTASAEKDELTGGWILKAGAMVLGSGGIVMIDEFDKMDPDDRSALHEAMEQQSYHGSTKILMADGREVEIEKLVDELMKDQENKVKTGINCEILPLESGEVKLLTSDFKKIYATNATQVSRHTAPRTFYKVFLTNGRNVTVTPEHPFWVLTQTGIKTKPASELKETDYISVPRKLPIIGKEQNLEYMRDKIEELKVKIPGKFEYHNGPELCRLVGYHITDGCYELNRGKKNGIQFANKNLEVINDYVKCAEAVFGIAPKVSINKNQVLNARLISKKALAYLKALDKTLAETGEYKIIPPVIMQTTNENIIEMLRAMFESDGWVSDHGIGFISGNELLAQEVQTLLLRISIESKIWKEELKSGKEVYRVFITGKENVEKYGAFIGFISSAKNKKLSDKIANASKIYRSTKDVFPIGQLVAETCRSLKLPESTLIGSITYKKSATENFSRKSLEKIKLGIQTKLTALQEAKVKVNQTITIQEYLNARRALGFSQDEISKELKIKRQTLTYWEKHGNNLDLLIKGLTARIQRALAEATPKVEQIKNLVESEVAWNSIIKIEKIPNSGEKWVYDIGIEPTHAFISHNMVLHNSISIAKAGMLTTFQTKASVLAAANPKFGRFDPNAPPANQFDIPPALLSRFDLIFTIKDAIDEAHDRKLAEHIILGHMAGSTKEKLASDSAILPSIESDLLRKFIAYARRSCFPILTNEANEKIKDFYLELRKMGKKSNTFPITARQIEGVIRLAEASAKVRLSPRVELQDAERAIGLVSFVLHDVFTDKETGLIDSDIVNIGQPKSKVDKLRTLMNVIASLEKQFDLVDVDDVVKECTVVNIDETTTRKMVDELKKQGDLYEPKPGYIKAARRKGEW